MPNERNLIPMEKRSPEEAREMGRKGGRASGEARRRKKSLREAAELYLSLPVSDKRKWNKLSEDGVPPEDVNNQMAIIAGLACVDGVFLEESLEQKAEYLRGYSADILVMGDDWAGKFDSFAYICEVVYFPRTPSVSTTGIIEVIRGLL